MNPFESGERRMVPAVLVYPRYGIHPADSEFLMLHRNAQGRVGDYHAGKWNGLGGKCEADESALEAAVRELGEESGLRPGQESFRPLGVIHFPNFKAHKCEDWLVTVFSVRVTERERKATASGPEGQLEWV